MTDFRMKVIPSTSLWEHIGVEASEGGLSSATFSQLWEIRGCSTDWKGWVDASFGWWLSHLQGQHSTDDVVWTEEMERFILSQESGEGCYADSGRY